VDGGVVGGVPGGQLGGCLGCTGDGPVMDYDQPPRVIKLVQPRYPQEAFVKKIEGTVVLEILIDINGHVPRARVVQSIPALDAAAIDTVKQWIFNPAVKHGHPVATIARAPVTFRIY
jgi:periplasmic protein TonB